MLDSQPVLTTGPGPYTQYRATLGGLAENASYSVECGWLESTGGAPVRARFRLPPTSSLDFAPRIVMFGDLGWTDDQILPFLREEVAAGAVDMVVIFGDMVYWSVVGTSVRVPSFVVSRAA